MLIICHMLNHDSIIKKKIPMRIFFTEQIERVKHYSGLPTANKLYILDISLQIRQFASQHDNIFSYNHPQTANLNLKRRCNHLV